MCVCQDSFPDSSIPRTYEDGIIKQYFGFSKHIGFSPFLFICFALENLEGFFCYSGGVRVFCLCFSFDEMSFDDLASVFLQVWISWQHLEIRWFHVKIQISGFSWMIEKCSNLALHVSNWWHASQWLSHQTFPGSAGPASRFYVTCLFPTGHSSLRLDVYSRPTDSRSKWITHLIVTVIICARLLLRPGTVWRLQYNLFYVLMYLYPYTMPGT